MNIFQCIKFKYIYAFNYLQKVIFINNLYQKYKILLLSQFINSISDSSRHLTWIKFLIMF